jgi:hypothetical protein
VVAFGQGPQIGESITGDVVNTASRLQNVAPTGGIVVGELTHHATARQFKYRAFEPVVVKGKAEPLAIWRPVAARSRTGVDLRERPSTAFVGRADESALLRQAWRRVEEHRRNGAGLPQLVTITGEAGVSKSRLIQELGALADEWPGLVRWRQGRSLPYGEGLSFWALGEMVKADAGILESDSPGEADAKLRRSLEAHVRDPEEHERLRVRLAPLVGAEGTPFDAPREQLFEGWRRWFEALASTSPFVAVFEDLQWADEVMLEFIEHLVDWAAGLPLLVSAPPDPSSTSGTRPGAAAGATRRRSHCRRSPRARPRC